MDRLIKIARTAAVVAALLVLGISPAGAWDGGDGGYLVAQAPQELMVQAGQAMNKGDFDEAVRVIERAYQADPFDDSVKAMAVKAYNARGWERLGKDDIENGMADFKRAGSFAKKKDYETYLGLGYGSFRLRNYDDALYYLYDAVYINPDDPGGHELIGSIYYQRGRLEDAVSEWETVLRLKPDNAQVKQMLAKARKELEVEGGFKRRETYYFNVKYEGEERYDLGDMVLDILDSAYRDIGGDLEFYPSEPVTVILYTKQQFSSVTDAPNWSNGVYDGSIRVPVGGQIDKRALADVLYHEYAHAVVAIISGGGVPTWVNEGLAQHEERWVLEKTPRLSREQAVPLTKLEGPFVGISDPEQARAAYDQSLSAVRYFIDKFGTYNLVKLIRLSGDGRPMSEAVRECTGISYNDFERYWLAGLPD